MSPEVDSGAREQAAEATSRIIKDNRIAASGDGRFRNATFLRDATYFYLQASSKPQNGEFAIINRGAKGTLEVTASHQGRKSDPLTCEEEDKFPHEIQGKDSDQERLEAIRSGGGPVIEVDGHLEMITYWALDANPLWNRLFARYVRATRDFELRDRLWQNFERSQAWVERFGDGLIFGGPQHEKSPRNQFWKDSENSLILEDGSLPKYPIAPLDVNSHAYRADLESAELYESIGDLERAKRLRERARCRRELINEKFWMEDMRLFAPALDADGNPIRIPTSDSVIALWAGVPHEGKNKVLAKRLLEEDLFIPGRGLLSRSRNSIQFNSSDYQNGNIWYHLAFMGGAACEEQGMPEEAKQLDSCVPTVANEGFKELDGTDLAGNVFPYTEDGRPVACRDQAWVIGGVLNRTAH